MGYKVEKVRYEKRIAESLGMSEEEMKYIYAMENDYVAISFPVEMNIEVSVDNKALKLDGEVEHGLIEKACQFCDDVMYKGGFINNTRYYSYLREQTVEYFKRIENDDEAKEAIKWLVAFKKRIGI